MPLRRIVSACILAAGLYTGVLAFKNEHDLPPLSDGDLIFQTSWTSQSIAVGIATWSLYLHTGIIKTTPTGPVVVHAGAQVGETPLSDWIDGGILQRFAVYRYKDLSPDQAINILNQAAQYYGKYYDIYFLFHNDKLYCSELPYLAYQESGIPIGKVEKIGNLSVNNYFSKKVIEQRWRSHPECQAKDMTFEQCYESIMQQTLVTPTSLAEDSHFERIFTNYPAL